LEKGHWRGKCGIPEIIEPQRALSLKAERLASLLRGARHVVVHTGAGISTASGVPDFRGPNGVWTREERSRKASGASAAAVASVSSFEDATPTFTHMALKTLLEHGFVHYVVSQNVDGLHLRSGLSRNHLSELHGNVFVEKCVVCCREFLWQGG